MPRRTEAKATGLRARARKAALAAIGAASLARETLAETFRKCVERGEKVEPELRRRFQALTKRTAQAKDRVAHRVNGAVREWRARLPFATRGDLEALERRIEQVARRIEKKAQPAGATN
jgi:polyhydroxyalkanoate synthesis regulator phasin